MLEQLEEQFTKYELARIIGARALQISMDAPMLLKISDEELEKINFNPIDIAKMELSAGVLPITVNKPMPKKRESKIKKMTAEEVEELRKKEAAREAELKEIKEREDKGKEAKSAKIAEKKVVEDTGAESEVVPEKAEEQAEIMELANPEDEAEESSGAGREEEGI